MKRLAVAVILAFVMAVSTASAQGTVQTGRSTVAYPAQAELDRFPIIWKKTPSQAEVARTMGALGLRLEALKIEWTGYNWYRDLGRFVYETIPAGTLVYVDSTGTPRYRADCANRLVEASKCPLCASIGLKDSTSNRLMGPAVPTDSAVAQSKSAGFWSRLTDGVKGLALGLWGAIVKVLAPFLWLLLLLAGLVLLAWLVMWAVDRLVSGNTVRPVHPESVATPPTPPVAPRGNPTPAPATTPAPIVDVAIPAQPAGARPEVEVAPVVSPTRRFVAFYPGEPGADTMIRFGGVRDVRYEEQGGETTIRFRQQK